MTKKNNKTLGILVLFLLVGSAGIFGYWFVQSRDFSISDSINDDSLDNEDQDINSPDENLTDDDQIDDHDSNGEWTLIFEEQPIDARYEPYSTFEIALSTEFIEYGSYFVKFSMDITGVYTYNMLFMEIDAIHYDILFNQFEFNIRSLLSHVQIEYKMQVYNPTGYPVFFLLAESNVEKEFSEVVNNDGYADMNLSLELTFILA